MRPLCSLTDDPAYPELRVPVRVLKRAAGVWSRGTRIHFTALRRRAD